MAWYPASSFGWSGSQTLPGSRGRPVSSLSFRALRRDLRSLGQGEVGLDIVAALSMSAALLFGETLAAAVVALMYSGGTFLESFAQGRARREMSDLLSRVPRTATRHRNGALDEVPLDDIAPGDLLLIRQGELAPVDGMVEAPARC